MSTSKNGGHSQPKADNREQVFQIIEKVQEIEGVGDIFTVSGFVGGMRGMFNDPADGLLTADSLEMHSFTSYLVLDIGKRPELPLGINEVKGEGQDE